MLLQVNITLKKELHSKQILRHFHYLKQGFDGNNVQKYIYYRYFTTSRNFDDRRLLCTPNILSIRNFYTRKVSTAISKETPTKNKTKNDSLDIFVNFLKNGNVNDARSF